MKNKDWQGKIFAVYKPKGPSSNQFLNYLKQVTTVKRIGHAGTLDPLASGVLVVGVGREATKKLGKIVKDEKEYVADIRLGIESKTDDEEGEKERFVIARVPSLSDVKKTIKKFEGAIDQIPPIYSAVKIQGKEAYKRARQGEIFNLPPRKVTIKKIEFLKYKWPKLKIKIVTGPGVYVRALARDLGQELKVGAYLFDLKRTRVGKFTIDDAVNF